MSKSINDVVEDYRVRHVMEPIEAEAHAHLIAHRILEGLREPECEFPHKGSTCTHSVTHRAEDCTEQRNICQGARASIEERIEAGMVCSECDKPASRCWKVWPV